MNALMTWWIWLLLGLLLLGIEVLTPGAFFFLFFGLGGILTSLLAALGVAQEAWAQGLWFATASLLSLFVFRSQLNKRLEQTPARGYVELQGEMARLQANLLPGGTALAEFRGSVWTAKSKSSEMLPAGSKWPVDHIEGLTLWLKSEGGK